MIRRAPIMQNRRRGRFIPGWFRLMREREGAVAVEFAIVAPVFLIMLIGIFDVGQMLYAKSVLDGAVQAAARLSSLEIGDTEAADDMVERSVRPVLPSVEFETSRLSYFDFADIGRAERFNDKDANGECNDDETYVDENNNGEWDADIGVSGNGGANDVVLYSVTANYTPTFRVPFLPSGWTERTLSSTAVRKNQPFANQDDLGSTAGSCE